MIPAATPKKRGFSSYFSARLKAVSVFTVAAFLVSDLLGFPSQALASSAVSGQRSAVSKDTRVQELHNLRIPAELGAVIDEYDARSTEYGEKTKLKTPYPVHRAVFLIQDAHSVPDAQRSLAKLIEYLQEKYGVTTVAVEGAEGRLDPTLFRLFPDEKLRERVFTDYLSSGELSGAAAASVLVTNKMEFVGIEDRKLYEEGVAVFLDGLGKQAEFKAQSARLKDELQKLKNKYYSAEALEFDRQFHAWQAEQGEITAFLTYLSRFSKLSAPDSTIPVLFQILEQERKRNPKLEAEVKKLAWAMHKTEPGPVLNGLVQDYRTGRSSLGALAYGLTKLTRHPLLLSPELQRLVSNHEALISVKGPALLKELDALLAAVRSKLLSTPEANAVGELDERLGLLEKLVKFELSRDEWQLLQTKDHRLKTIDLKQIELIQLQDQLESFYRQTDSFQKFYVLALKREDVFSKKVFGLQSLVFSPVAVITGGFHTSGLAQRLRERDIPYAVVSPAIREVPQDNRYVDHMQGKISWAKYFRPVDGRIDLYDAFSRATVDRLTSRSSLVAGKSLLTSDQRPATRDLKEWRDDIIRTLAQEGRVAQHSKYTRYIDRQIAGNSEAFQALKEKWTAKLEKFIDGLRFLHGKNQLTEANVAKLLSQPANQTPYAVPMVPGAWVPADFLGDMVEGIGYRKASVQTELSPKPYPLYPKEVPLPSPARMSLRSETRTLPPVGSPEENALITRQMKMLSRMMKRPVLSHPILNDPDWQERLSPEMTPEDIYEDLEADWDEDVDSRNDQAGHILEAMPDRGLMAVVRNSDPYFSRVVDKAWELLIQRKNYEVLMRIVESPDEKGHSLASKRAAALHILLKIEARDPGILTPFFPRFRNILMTERRGFLQDRLNAAYVLCRFQQWGLLREALSSFLWIIDQGHPDDVKLVPFLGPIGAFDELRRIANSDSLPSAYRQKASETLQQYPSSESIQSRSAEPDGVPAAKPADGREGGVNPVRAEVREDGAEHIGRAPTGRKERLGRAGHRASVHRKRELMKLRMEDLDEELEEALAGESGFEERDGFLTEGAAEVDAQEKVSRTEAVEISGVSEKKEKIFHGASVLMLSAGFVALNVLFAGEYGRFMKEAGAVSRAAVKCLICGVTVSIGKYISQYLEVYYLRSAARIKADRILKWGLSGLLVSGPVTYWLWLDFLTRLPVGPFIKAVLGLTVYTFLIGNPMKFLLQEKIEGRPATFRFLDAFRHKEEGRRFWTLYAWNFVIWFPVSWMGWWAFKEHMVPITASFSLLWAALYTGLLSRWTATKEQRGQPPSGKKMRVPILEEVTIKAPRSEVRERKAAKSKATLNVLTVCNGNMERSPLAEKMIKRSLPEDIRQNVFVSSAGVRAEEIWTGLRDFSNRDFLRNIYRHPDLRGHTPQQVTRELLEWADLVLIATKTQEVFIRENFPDQMKKVGRILAGDQELEFSGLEDYPEGPGAVPYAAVARKIEESMPDILARIRRALEQKSKQKRSEARTEPNEGEESPATLEKAYDRFKRVARLHAMDAVDFNHPGTDISKDEVARVALDRLRRLYRAVPGAILVPRGKFMRIFQSGVNGLFRPLDFLNEAQRAGLLRWYEGQAAYQKVTPRSETRTTPGADRGEQDATGKVIRQVTDWFSRLVESFSRKLIGWFSRLIDWLVRRVTDWYGRQYSKLLLKLPDFRMLVYLVDQLHLPSSHKISYTVLGIIFALSGTPVEASKIVVLPAFAALLPFPFDVVVTCVLALWMGSILRASLVMFPLWLGTRLFSKQPLRIDPLLRMNFIPFAGAWGSVIGHLLAMTAEHYKDFGGISFWQVRSLNQVISKRLVPEKLSFSLLGHEVTGVLLIALAARVQNAFNRLCESAHGFWGQKGTPAPWFEWLKSSPMLPSLSDADLRRLRFFSPEITFLILAFQSKKQLDWNGRLFKVRRATLGDTGLQKKIDRNNPSLFIGSEDDYDHLRTRIRRELEPDIRRRVLSRLKKNEEKQKVQARQAVAKRFPKALRKRSPEKFEAEVLNEYSQKVTRSRIDEVQVELDQAIARLPFYRFETKKYLGLRRSHKTTGYEQLVRPDPKSVIVPLFDIDIEKTTGFPWPEKPASGKIGLWVRYIAKLLQIAGAFEPETKVWGLTKRGPQEVFWGEWMGHGMANGLSFVESYEKILALNNPDLLKHADMAFDQAEAAFMQRRALAEKLEGDLPEFFLRRSGNGRWMRAVYRFEKWAWRILRFFFVPPVTALKFVLGVEYAIKKNIFRRGMTEARPLTPIELAFYFPYRAFLANKDAARNRSIYAETVRRMEPAFAKLRDHIETLRTKNTRSEVRMTERTEQLEADPDTKFLLRYRADGVAVEFIENENSTLTLTAIIRGVLKKLFGDDYKQKMKGTGIEVKARNGGEIAFEIEGELMAGEVPDFAKIDRMLEQQAAEEGGARVANYRSIAILFFRETPGTEKAASRHVEVNLPGEPTTPKKKIKIDHAALEAARRRLVRSETRSARATKEAVLSGEPGPTIPAGRVLSWVELPKYETALSGMIAKNHGRVGFFTHVGRAMSESEGPAEADAVRTYLKNMDDWLSREGRVAFILGPDSGWLQRSALMRRAVVVHIPNTGSNDPIPMIEGRETMDPVFDWLKRLGVREITPYGGEYARYDDDGKVIGGLESGIGCAGGPLLMLSRDFPVQLYPQLTLGGIVNKHLAGSVPLEAGAYWTRRSEMRQDPIMQSHASDERNKSPEDAGKPGRKKDEETFRAARLARIERALERIPDASFGTQQQFYAMLARELAADPSDPEQISAPGIFGWVDKYLRGKNALPPAIEGIQKKLTTKDRAKRKHRKSFGPHKSAAPPLEDVVARVRAPWKLRLLEVMKKRILTLSGVDRMLGLPKNTFERLITAEAVPEERLFIFAKALQALTWEGGFEKCFGLTQEEIQKTDTVFHYVILDNQQLAERFPLEAYYMALLFIRFVSEADIGPLLDLISLKEFLRPRSAIQDHFWKIFYADQDLKQTNGFGGKEPHRLARELIEALHDRYPREIENLFINEFAVRKKRNDLPAILRIRTLTFADQIDLKHFHSRSEARVQVVVKLPKDFAKEGELLFLLGPAGAGHFILVARLFRITEKMKSLEARIESLFSGHPYREFIPLLTAAGYPFQNAEARAIGQSLKNMRRVLGAQGQTVKVRSQAVRIPREWLDEIGAAPSSLLADISEPDLLRISKRSELRFDAEGPGPLLNVVQPVRVEKTRIVMGNEAPEAVDAMAEAIFRNRLAGIRRPISEKESKVSLYFGEEKIAEFEFVKDENGRILGAINTIQKISFDPSAKYRLGDAIMVPEPNVADRGIVIEKIVPFNLFSWMRSHAVDAKEVFGSTVIPLLGAGVLMLGVFAGNHWLMSGGHERVQAPRPPPVGARVPAKTEPERTDRSPVGAAPRSRIPSELQTRLDGYVANVAAMIAKDPPERLIVLKRAIIRGGFMRRLVNRAGIEPRVSAEMLEVYEAKILALVPALEEALSVRTIQEAEQLEKISVDRKKGMDGFGPSGEGRSRSGAAAVPRSEARKVIVDEKRVIDGSEIEIMRKGMDGVLSSDEKEVLALTDEKGVIVPGRHANKDRVHGEGLWHMTAHVYLVDRRGRLLLQKRASRKSASPGRLQVSVSGHVNFGEEPVAAAIREAAEEVGILPDFGRLIQITAKNGIRRSYRQDDGLINNEFTTAFFYPVTDEELAEIREKYNLKESDELWLVPMSGLEQLVQNNPDLFSNTIRFMITKGRDIFEKILSRARQNRSESRREAFGAFQFGPDFTETTVRRLLDQLIQDGKADIRTAEGEVFSAYFQFQEHAYRGRIPGGLLRGDGGRFRVMVSHDDGTGEGIIGLADVKLVKRDGRDIALMDNGYGETDVLVDTDSKMAIQVADDYRRTFSGIGTLLLHLACGTAQTHGAERLVVEKIVAGQELFYQRAGADIQLYGERQNTASARSQAPLYYTKTRAVFDLVAFPNPGGFRIVRKQQPKPRSETRQDIHSPARTRAGTKEVPAGVRVEGPLEVNGKVLTVARSKKFRNSFSVRDGAGRTAGVFEFSTGNNELALVTSVRDPGLSEALVRKLLKVTGGGLIVSDIENPKLVHVLEKIAQEGDFETFYSDEYGTPLDLPEMSRFFIVPKGLRLWTDSDVVARIDMTGDKIKFNKVKSSEPLPQEAFEFVMTDPRGWKEARLKPSFRNGFEVLLDRGNGEVHARIRPRSETRTSRTEVVRTKIPRAGLFDVLEEIERTIRAGDGSIELSIGIEKPDRSIVSFRLEKGENRYRGRLRGLGIFSTYPRADSFAIVINSSPDLKSQTVLVVPEERVSFYQGRERGNEPGAGSSSVSRSDKAHSEALAAIRATDQGKLLGDFLSAFDANTGLLVTAVPARSRLILWKIGEGTPTAIRDWMGVLELPRLRSITRFENGSIRGLDASGQSVTVLLEKISDPAGPVPEARSESRERASVRWSHGTGEDGATLAGIKIVALKNPSGIHARPSAGMVQLAEAAKKAPDISVRIINTRNGKKADAADLMDLLWLEAFDGNRLEVTVTGKSGQEKAIGAILEVLEDYLEDTETQEAGTRLPGYIARIQNAIARSESRISTLNAPGVYKGEKGVEPADPEEAMERDPVVDAANQVTYADGHDTAQILELLHEAARLKPSFDGVFAVIGFGQGIEKNLKLIADTLPKAQVLGIDYEADVVRGAREQLLSFPEACRSRIRIEQGNARDLRKILKDGSAGIVYFENVFDVYRPSDADHQKLLHDMVRESHRVLRPDGLLVINDAYAGLASEKIVDDLGFESLIRGGAGSVLPLIVRKQAAARSETSIAYKLYSSTSKEADAEAVDWIAELLMKGKTEPGRSELRRFVEMARADFERTAALLRDRFENIFLSKAFAEITGESAGLASGYEALERVLAEKHLSREGMEQVAEQIFDRELKTLAEAIRKKEIGGMAPVVFYSPEIKARLIRFIETVQQGFETEGDVTGKNYRITLVSANRSELRGLKTELSKRGALRGVQFVEDTKAGAAANELASSVIRHPVFGERFGVFFPETDLGQSVAWQRVVRSEVPKEYAILLLPALARYFSSVSTSSINATTLRRALPDLFASAAFRVGQGIAIVAAFLEHLAAAERQLSVSA